MNEKGTAFARAVMVAAPVAMALGASPAIADPVSKPLAVQIGLGDFTGNAGDKTNRSGFHVGASWTMGSQADMPGSRYGIDVDENYNSGKGANINVVGLTVTERAPLQAKVAPGKPAIYAGLGLGVFNIQAHNAGVVVSGNPGSGTPGTVHKDSYSKTNFGGKVMLGVDMGQTFVEGTYILAGTVSGVRADSVNIAVGVHF